MFTDLYEELECILSLSLTVFVRLAWMSIILLHECLRLQGHGRTGTFSQYDSVSVQRNQGTYISTTLTQKDYENISLVLADPILNDAQQTV